MNTLSLSFKNEHGSTIVVAMLILVFLTIIGISAINTSSFESQIVGNEHRYQIEFYVADSGWKEGAMWLENLGGPPPKKNPGTSTLVRNWGDGDAKSGGWTIQEVINSPDNDSLSKYGIPYWYEIEYMQDDVVTGSGSGWREFVYTARSNADQKQEIEVVLLKIFKVGY